MRDTDTSSIVSPDGLYEINVEETVDRFEMLYDTVLKERATGKRLFTCRGAPRAEFAADGTLNVYYPGYEPDGIQIDPSRAVFRTHSSESWIPLAAWPIVEAAYGRGWAQAFDYRAQSRQATFPWASILLLLSSVAALLLLSVQTLLTLDVQRVLMLLAGVGVLFFGWLAAVDFRTWAHVKKTLARTSRPR